MSFIFSLIFPCVVTTFTSSLCSLPASVITTVCYTCVSSPIYHVSIYTYPFLRLVARPSLLVFQHPFQVSVSSSVWIPLPCLSALPCTDLCQINDQNFSSVVSLLHLDLISVNPQYCIFFQTQSYLYFYWVMVTSYSCSSNYFP